MVHKLCPSTPKGAHKFHQENIYFYWKKRFDTGITCEHSRYPTNLICYESNLPGEFQNMNFTLHRMKFATIPNPPSLQDPLNSRRQYYVLHTLKRYPTNLISLQGNFPGV